MTFVDMEYAKKRLLYFVNDALKGQEVVITREGKPLVKLVPYKEHVLQRRGGQFNGIMQINDNFDDPLSEEELNNFSNIS